MSDATNCGIAGDLWHPSPTRRTFSIVYTHVYPQQLVLYTDNPASTSLDGSQQSYSPSTVKVRTPSESCRPGLWSWLRCCFQSVVQLENKMHRSCAEDQWVSLELMAVPAVWYSVSPCWISPYHETGHRCDGRGNGSMLLHRKCVLLQ
jgi:hypothetical protein